MSFTMWDYLILFGVLGVAIYIYGVWNYDYFKNRNVKFIKPIPYLGNMAPLYFNLNTFNKLIQKFYNTFPDQRYIGTFDLRTPSVCIRDPDLIKQLTIKDFDHFTDHVTITTENMDPLFTNNLFALQGQKWRDMRSTLSPAFTSSKMRNMYPFIADCAEQLVTYADKECDLPLANGQNSLEVEIKELYTRYTNDVIATTAFGIKVNSLTDKKNEFYMMGKKITNFSTFILFKILGFVAFPRLMKVLKISLTGADVADFFRNLVRNTMTTREVNNIHRPDMIQLLMQAKKGSLDYDDTMTNTADYSHKEHIHKRNWSDNDLTAQAFVFFLAGFETTSTLLTYATYELAANQDVQDKLRNEVDDVIANGGLTYEVLNKMKYMDMFISETLRIWPPVPVVDRMCVKPYVLPPPNNHSTTSFEMKKSDRILIPIYGLHKDPKYFENPDKFDPERFSDENKDKIQPFTYVPFGFGPRICIGSRFALMEIKTAVFYMVSKFLLVPSPKTKDPTQWKMSNASSIPVGGLFIGLKKRSE